MSSSSAFVPSKPAPSSSRPTTLPTLYQFSVSPPNAPTSLSATAPTPHDPFPTPLVPVRTRKPASSLCLPYKSPVEESIRTLRYHTCPTSPSAVACDTETPATVLAYKKTTKQILTVAVPLPEDLHVDLRTPFPPSPRFKFRHTFYFTPDERLTQERYDDVFFSLFNFPQPETVKLAAHTLKIYETTLACTDAERSTSRDN